MRKPAFQPGDVRTKASRAAPGINIGLGLALMTILMGCVGYVDGSYGTAVVVPAPDVYFYGGPYYERGRDVRVYSHRGYESRAIAHPGGGPGRKH